MKYNTARRRAFDFFFSMRLCSARTMGFFVLYGRSVFGKTYHKGMEKCFFMSQKVMTYQIVFYLRLVERAPRLLQREFDPSGAAGKRVI